MRPVAASTGEVLLVALRLLVGASILAALHLAWRGGAFTRSRGGRPAGGRARWAWTALGAAGLLLAVEVMRARLTEPDDERATALAFLIVMGGAVVLSAAVGAVVGLRIRRGRRRR